MRLTKRKALLVLVASLVVAGCKTSKTTEDDLITHGNAAYKQYKTADYAIAKAALLDHVSLLDRTAASDPKSAYVYNQDAITSYVRLAKLEEKNHGSEQARYMSEASSRCGKLNPKAYNCSPDFLRAATDKMDTIPPK